MSIKLTTIILLSVDLYSIRKFYWKALNVFWREALLVKLLIFSSFYTPGSRSGYTDPMIADLIGSGSTSLLDMILVVINIWYIKIVSAEVYLFQERGEGGRMCHFLKPLKLTQELSQKMSYSSELRYGSCFYDVY